MTLGSATLGHWRGVPVRIHWTAPLGAFVLGGFRFAPGFWFGFLLLVVVHELGHAAVVLRAGGDVLEAVVSGFGGVCRWRGSVSKLDRALIAWGGVGAQAILFVLTWLALRFVAQPHSLGAFQMVNAFTDANVFLILLNLLPIPPLDGAEAWKILGLLKRKASSLRAKKGQAQPVEEPPEIVADGNLPPELDAAIADLSARAKKKNGS